MCREGPARVLELVKMGADFTRNAGEQVSVQCGQDGSPSFDRAASIAADF